MSAVDRITYRASDGSGGSIHEAATSLWDQAGSDRWLRRLEPWLRAGRPQSSAYLDFGEQAAFIRWHAEAGSSHWQYALALVGGSNVLTTRHAVELPDAGLAALLQGDGHLPLGSGERDSAQDAVELAARSADACALLIPLLAHALRGERRVAMP